MGRLTSKLKADVTVAGWCFGQFLHKLAQLNRQRTRNKLSPRDMPGGSLRVVEMAIVLAHTQMLRVKLDFQIAPSHQVSLITC